MNLLSRIEDAPRDGTYVRIVRPNGGFVLALWLRGAWRFANGCEVNFEPSHFLPMEGQLCPAS